MTADHQPQAHGPGDSPWQPGGADETHRPGPLPPRIEPPHQGAGPYPATTPYPGAVQYPATSGYPAPTGQPAALHPGAAQYPTTSPYPAVSAPEPPTMAWSAPPPSAAPPPAATLPPVAGPTPTAGQWGGQEQPSGVPEQWSPPTAQPAPGSWPAGGASAPSASASSLAGQPAPAPARARRGWLGVVTLVLVGLLIVVTGVQAYQINRLDDQLADTGKRLEAAQNGDSARLEGLETRADALEKQAGDVFNPEAIAAAVLPSVFRVRAGQFTGTAFAVGEPVAGGGAYLFTNHHVIEAIWDAGEREVFLERTGQRFPARIEKVDEANDLAQLKTDGRFVGLAPAESAVKSGQQIVVVGAPLGLTDSVTTGVVSAFRKNQNGPGEVIQFDAPINPGNSGGPVINSAKEVVGIATAKARDSEGIGLAVPIKTACDSFKIC